MTKKHKYFLLELSVRLKRTDSEFMGSFFKIDLVFLLRELRNVAFFCLPLVSFRILWLEMQEVS